MRKFERISEEQFNKDAPNEDYSEVVLPRRATRKSAGYDIYSPIEINIPAGGQVKIPTGLKVYMESQDVMLMVPRSSLAIKHGLKIVNQVGVIDADYYNNHDNEGHFWIVLENTSDKDYKVEIGERIAQCIFTYYSTTVDDEPLVEERVGGFGSTGTK